MLKQKITKWNKPSKQAVLTRSTTTKENTLGVIFRAFWRREKRCFQEITHWLCKKKELIFLFDFLVQRVTNEIKKLHFLSAQALKTQKKWSPHPSFFTRNKRLQNFSEVIFDTKKILGQKRPQIFSNAHNPNRRKETATAKHNGRAWWKSYIKSIKHNPPQQAPPAK